VNHSSGTPSWGIAFELYQGDVWFICGMKKVRSTSHTFGEPMLGRFRQSFLDVVNNENCFLNIGNNDVCYVHVACVFHGLPGGCHRASGL
jgi:hypothetical protein